MGWDGLVDGSGIHHPSRPIPTLLYSAIVQVQDLILSLAAASMYSAICSTPLPCGQSGL